MWISIETIDGNAKAFIKPEFFDFSKTPYVKGIPVFRNTFDLSNSDDKKELDMSVKFFEEKMAVGSRDLSLRAKEEGVSPKDLVEDFFNMCPERAFVKEIGVINKEKKAIEAKFSFSHPFVDLLKNESLGIGVIVTDLAFDPRDVDKIKEKSIELNKIFFDIICQSIDK